MDTTGKVATERRGARPSVTVAILASIVAVVLLVLSLTLLFRRDAEEGERKTDASRFILPPRSIDATDILGRPRSAIRALLGQPTLSEELLDSFDIGLPLDVRYEHDIAAGLSLTAPGISRHERQVRRWLHLPPEGALRIGGKSYRVAYFVGDDNRLALNLDDNESMAVPTKAVAAPMPVPSAEQLLRSFPNLPPRLKTSCRSVAQGKALVCAGFNAKVSVEVDGKGDPTALTVIDPPGRNSEAECRAAIEQLVAGVAATSPGSRHYSSDKLDALYVFSPGIGGPKQSGCSLMVCRKSADIGGTRTPCGG